jgi:hypothetical protein
MQHVVRNLALAPCALTSAGSIVIDQGVVDHLQHKAWKAQETVVRLRVAIGS